MIRARGVTPNSLALAADISIVAAAPSFREEEFAAVTEPDEMR